MENNRKKTLRSILFRHLDGIALAPIVSTFEQRGVNKFILNNPNFSFQDIASEFDNNAGYFNVALRLLASQGWLDRQIVRDGEQIKFSLSEKGYKCLNLSSYYVDYSEYLPILINLDNYIFHSSSHNEANELNYLVSQLIKLDINNKFEWEVSKHLEGLLVGPILVALGMSKFFDDFLDNNTINTKDFNSLPFIQSVINFFHQINWINNNSINENGIFYLKRSSAYGVTVSYLPTFLQAPELLFGNPNILWEKQSNRQEIHVNRRMNVWGSGGAHSLYFKKIDEIIKNVFNEPIEKQPIGIADMGCGDGTLLKHLYHVIEKSTERGKCLDKHPLIIIGADYNKAARLASTITLKEAGIKHSIVTGNITDPDLYAKTLNDKFGIRLEQMLNVRSFLDHNRIYSEPKFPFNKQICNSTGAFAFRGRWIPNNELKQNLIEHFLSWKKYISKFGLLILELHTIDPILTASNLGKTLATAYDSTHGFSDQYIFEIETFLSAAKQAGLHSEPKYKTSFPNDKLTTISINLFRTI